MTVDRPIRIAVIAGSTRPGRKSLDVGRWALETAGRPGCVELELVDLAEHPLPLLDEGLPPRFQQYENPLVWAWSRTIDAFDGFVVVTPEYNHAPPAVLKNAVDWLYNEWNDKAIGFVGYGVLGGARAVEQLRLVSGELQLADVRTQVGLSLFDDFEEYTRFAPRELHAAQLSALVDEVATWAGALRAVRAAKASAAA